MSNGKGIRAYMARTFNIYQWAGAKSLIDSGNNIKSLFNAMVRVKKSTRQETFAQAVVRLDMTVQDVEDKVRQYRMTSSVFALFFIFGLAYSAILWLRYDRMTCVMGVAYSMLMFAFFFRESFWYMQIKKRRLGMSIVEWVKFIMWLDGE